MQGTGIFSGAGEEWHSQGSVLLASCNSSSSTAGALELTEIGISMDFVQFPTLCVIPLKGFNLGRLDFEMKMRGSANSLQAEGRGPP
jgi:hypothetical protein